MYIIIILSNITNCKCYFNTFGFFNIKKITATVLIREVGIIYLLTLTIKGGITMVNYAELGNRISKRRNHLNYTQEKLAEKSGLSTTYVGNIERATSKCSIDTLMKLCFALDCTPDFLLLNTENDNKVLIENIAIEAKRCTKAQQKLLLSYIKWLSNQNI